MNTNAGMSQASRNSARPRLTGIQAQAERQIRSAASAVVRSRSGAATRTHRRTIRLSNPAPSSRAVIAIAPRTSAGADSRTKCFWSGVGRVSGTLRGGRPRRLGGRCASAAWAGTGRHRLAVQHRHPGFPALVVHGRESIGGAVRA